LESTAQVSDATTKDRTAFVEREKLVCSHVGEAGIEAAGVQQLVDFSVAWELPVPR
jgi:hypothetical protein